MGKEKMNDNEKMTAVPMEDNAYIKDEEYVLIVLNDEKPMYFETCEIHAKERCYELGGFRHMGFSTDTLVIATDLLEKEDVPELDFRYIAKPDNLIQVYLFNSDISKVYVKNRGKKPIRVDRGFYVNTLHPGPLPYEVSMDDIEV